MVLNYHVGKHAIHIFVSVGQPSHMFLNHRTVATTGRAGLCRMRPDFVSLIDCCFKQRPYNVERITCLAKN